MSNEVEQPNWLMKNWPMLVMVLAGAVLICSAAYVAQTNDVAHRISLDLNGVHATAIAEPMGADQYRLRLTMDSAIYSRLYKGKIAGAPEGTKGFTVPVVYDSAAPGRFLPAGLSYKPAVLAGILFIAGMAVSLYARRATYAAARLQGMRMPKLAKANKKAERPSGSHKHHHRKHRHHNASHHSAGN